jgi:amidase
MSFNVDSLYISINSSKSSGSCSTYSEIPLVDPITASIKTLAEDLAACRYSSSDLIRWYLSRIDAVNRQGSHPLHAVIETNPDALDIADALDQERRINGSRSYLHGIPILVKDNIATDDKMETTAGSLALVGSRVPRDAFTIQKLRQAGAIILGKSSLTEWANIKSENGTRGGWSARGGLSR